MYYFIFVQKNCNGLNKMWYMFMKAGNYVNVFINGEIKSCWLHCNLSLQYLSYIECSGMWGSKSFRLSLYDMPRTMYVIWLLQYCLTLPCHKLVVINFSLFYIFQGYDCIQRHELSSNKTGLLAKLQCTVSIAGSEKTNLSHFLVHVSPKYCYRICQTCR